MKIILTAFACLATLFSTVGICETTEPKKVHARFVGKPKADSPIKVVMFHGLGRKPESLEKWAKKEFADSKKGIAVKVLDYKKIGLQEFEKKIATVLMQIEKQKDNKEIMSTLQKEEAKLLPQLRELVSKNMNKILAEIGKDTPLENVIFVGYSLGGLVSSVVVEVLGNSKYGQVQALLTSTAPPVGLINCRLGVGEPADGLTPSTLFPWMLYSEIGEQDEIFVNGVAKVVHCFSIFDELDGESKKHFMNKSYEGTHKVSDSFHKETLHKAIEVALKRKSGDESAFTPLA